LPGNALAAETEGTHSYLVIYEADDAASTSITRETLTIQTKQGRTYVVIANADGAAAGFPAALAADGEIEGEPGEPAIVCYNVAMSLVAQHERNPAGPLSIVLSLGGRPAPVPLTVQRQPASSSEIVATGQLGGAAVDTRIDLDAGSLSEATVLELSFGGAPPRVLGRTLCTMGSASRATPVEQPVERT
jgi:hypothetical protein